MHHHWCHRSPSYSLHALHHLSFPPPPQWLKSRCGRLPLPGLNLTRPIPPVAAPGGRWQPGSRAIPTTAGWSEAQSGGHAKAPWALPPPAAAPTGSRSEAGSSGGGRAGQFLGPLLRGDFLAGAGRRGRGGLATRGEATALWGYGLRAGPLRAGKGRRPACSWAVAVGTAAAAARQGEGCGRGLTPPAGYWTAPPGKTGRGPPALRQEWPPFQDGGSLADFRGASHVSCLTKSRKKIWKPASPPT